MTMVDGWMEGRMTSHGWTDGWKDGWMVMVVVVGGWMDGCRFLAQIVAHACSIF